MTSASTTVGCDPALEPARAIADAVLYEGYVLFPYRASAMKNRYRWQWGVLVPAEQVTCGATEPSEASFAVPLRADDGASVTVTARFLHLRRRQVHDPDGHPIERAEVDGTLHVSWDEGIEREVVIGPLAVRDLLAEPHVERFEFPRAAEEQGLADGSSVHTSSRAIDGELVVEATEVEPGVVALSCLVRNMTPWSRAGADREVILRRSLVGCHLMISSRDADLGSVIDPPEWARTAATRCRGRVLYPVLVSTGEDGSSRDVVLASPIILEDHPRVAEDSPGPSFDGLEIDELLALCVQALADDEKREARATDPRAAALVDRAERLPPAVLERLHGRVREFGEQQLRPEPEAEVDDEMAQYFGIGQPATTQVEIDGRTVKVGDLVGLQPRRRADAHDLFVDGHLAHVEKIVATVDDEPMLAVTLRDDPAAELHRWYGRFQYFHLDEVAPCSGDEVAPCSGDEVAPCSGDEVAPPPRQEDDHELG